MRQSTRRLWGHKRERSDTRGAHTSFDTAVTCGCLHSSSASSAYFSAWWFQVEAQRARAQAKAREGSQEKSHGRWGAHQLYHVQSVVVHHVTAEQWRRWQRNCWPACAGFRREEVL
jgi:hypothetical protein